MQAFRVIASKGWQVTFVNGWTVSVMFGRGNYADNRWDGARVGEAIEVSSMNAEVGVWKGDGEAQIVGWQTAAEVAAIMAKVEAFCHCGGDFKGSDHCPACGCEQFERTCDHVVSLPLGGGYSH